MTDDNIIHGSGTIIFENEKERADFFTLIEYYTNLKFDNNNVITEEIEVVMDLEENKMDENIDKSNEDLMNYLTNNTNGTKRRFFKFMDCCTCQKVKNNNSVKKIKDMKYLNMQEITESTELLSDNAETEEYINIKEYGIAPRIRKRPDIYENGYLNYITRIGRAAADQMNKDFIAELTALTPAKNIMLGSNDIVKDIKAGLNQLAQNEYCEIPDCVKVLIHPDKISELMKKYKIVTENVYDCDIIDIFIRDNQVVMCGFEFIISRYIPKDEIRIIDTSIPSIVYYDRESLTFGNEEMIRLRTVDLVAWMRFVFVVEFPDACVCIKEQ